MDRSPCRLHLGKKSPINGVPLTLISTRKAATLAAQLSSSYRRFLCNWRQWGGCGGAAVATKAIPEARGSPDQAFTIVGTRSHDHPVASYFPIGPPSCKHHRWVPCVMPPRRSDSSASLAPTPLFHPSPTSFNGAPSCCTHAPPSPSAGAPKPLITPLTVKIKRSALVQCFNLWPLITKPALQIGSPLINLSHRTLDQWSRLDGEGTPSGV
jgi:hypothetical protein